MKPAKANALARFLRRASGHELGSGSAIERPNDTEFSGERKRVRCNEVLGRPRTCPPRKDRGGGPSMQASSRAEMPRTSRRKRRTEPPEQAPLPNAHGSDGPTECRPS